MVCIFNQYHITYNDYSLNNIALHLIITIDRIKNAYVLPETVIPQNMDTVEAEVVKEIVVFLEKQYQIHFSQMEFENLLQFISCNFATVDYSHIDNRKAEEYVSRECMELTKDIIKQVEDYYYLDNFDEIFMSRFMLHMENLLRRIRSRYSAKNPIATEIKNTYPLIYDVAVFIANIIQEKEQYAIEQDEIAFIALHIGSFLEDTKQRKNKLAAIYIYADYHGFHRFNIEKLQKIFSENLDIRYTISFNDYYTVKPAAEVVISEFMLSGEDSVVVSPFITEGEIALIREKIQRVVCNKRAEEFQKDFSDMAKKELFFTNVYGKDRFETIQMLMKKIEPFDVFEPEFPKEVIKRERLSSTAFHNDIAIPHSISQAVKKSFISFTCYDKAVFWGEEKIRLVIVIGIAYNERRRFRTVFQQLVEILPVPANTGKISSSASYEELVANIHEIFQRK